MTLRDYIDRLRKNSLYISEKNLLEMFKKLCDGVNVLSQQNPPLAHRDIKPWLEDTKYLFWS